MKRSSSKDIQLQDWSKLLMRVRENQAELEGVAPLLAALEESHAQAVHCCSRRATLVASAQKATREIREAFTEGNDAAISLRSYIRALLGPRSKKLAHYGIKPLEKHRSMGRKPHTSGTLPS